MPLTNASSSPANMPNTPNSSRELTSVLTVLLAMPSACVDMVPIAITELRAQTAELGSVASVFDNLIRSMRKPRDEGIFAMRADQACDGVEPVSLFQATSSGKFTVAKVSANDAIPILARIVHVAS